MTNPQVDEFLNNATKWQEEMRYLRTLLLDCGLTEEWKWKQPCYTFQNSNVIIIGNFKAHCSLGFFKGVLLSDTEGLLVAPGENSQTVRMIKFTGIKEIVKLAPIIKAYIFEAIEVERAGLKVPSNDKKELVFVEELEKKLAEDSAFKTAFEALTPGRQRAYNIYFSAPKQAKTRETRIEKYTPRILDGKGFNDCVCGLSKKMPNCDGSHKQLQK